MSAVFGFGVIFSYTSLTIVLPRYRGLQKLQGASENVNTIVFSFQVCEKVTRLSLEQRRKIDAWMEVFQSPTVVRCLRDSLVTMSITCTENI